MIHLSVRLVWHDSAWNSHICQAPHLNASCVVHDYIREKRNDQLEMAHASEALATLDWLPPCTRDVGAYASRGFRVQHGDPLERHHLKPVPEDIPPYTATPAPYLWLREENARDLAERENLRLAAPTVSKERGWVMEPPRQRVLLRHFWGKLEAGNSLLFYYLRPGVPVDEDARRVIVGVGRLKDLGPQLYFNNTEPGGEMFPVWSRAITQNYPEEGVRLPYQEYLDAGHDIDPIVCRLPNGLIPYFSFVAEHVPDDVAVSVLELMLQAVTAVRDDGLVAGDWDRRLVWLNDALAEVWKERGAYPGIGSVLQYLGNPRGTAYQRLELRALMERNEDPWEHVVALLEGRAQPLNPDYEQSFDNARRRWAVFNPLRRELLATLARFELTETQVERIVNPDQRVQAGIVASAEEIIANPYLLYEQDLGVGESPPVELSTIDHGMRPEGEAAFFVQPVVQDDARRVRGVATAVLRQAAEQGDTLLPFNDLLAAVTDYFPERRACRPDREVVTAEADFYEQMLWLALDNELQLAGLQTLRDDEQWIARAIRARARRSHQAPAAPVDWREALIEGLNPTTEQHFAALKGQAEALETLHSQRISVLMGGAGTGKTSVLKIFLDEVAQPGERPLLLAPTGKARVRLATTAQRNAMTIHQFLLRQGWLNTDPFTVLREGGQQAGAQVVVVDECSMIPADLFAALLRALDMNRVRWLVLVGDPNQLPPIGPGRPFVDVIAWMREQAPQCLAELRVTTRVAVGSNNLSDALSLADGFRSGIDAPGDDAILATLAQGLPGNDVEARYWQDHKDLAEVLRSTLSDHLGLALDTDEDYQTLNRTFGIGGKPYEQDDFSEVERWQLLSPVRSHAHGTNELNRIIQLTYKMGLIHAGQNRRNMPRPFGEEDIVYTDKVIQVVNQRRRAWPDGAGFDYVANGEIGVVRSTRAVRNGSDYLDVVFATQPGASYRYWRSQVDETLELAYALTIHKVQGSEFEIVFLILPEEAPTLSRELIYTGLTRFSRRVVLLLQGDISTLRSLRRLEASDTLQRNTFLFELALRPETAATHNVPFPERLIHRTSTGVLVRSKSEVIVAETLHRLGVSYEYEKPLPAHDNPRDFRLPDFTVYYMGDVFYWEHLGMLAVPAYREKWERKRQWYEDNGHADQLLTSQDEPDGSIDAEAIERKIRNEILLE